MNEKLKLKLIEEKEKRMITEEEYRRYKGKLENFRDMLNRSLTGEKKKKESVKPKEIELNEDQSSDGCMNMEQFKKFLGVIVFSLAIIVFILNIVFPLTIYFFCWYYFLLLLYFLFFKLFLGLEVCCSCNMHNASA